MLVPDVTKDPRYIDAVPGVRSELVVPLLLKDRCIGVFDLESPEPNAFNKKHVKLLTLLASEAAVAIENARLYESIRASEARFEKELRFAQRVQMALLPQELPKRLRGVDVAWHFDPARELGGDLCDFLSPEAEHAGGRGGRRVGQGRAGGALQRGDRRDGARPHVQAPAREDQQHAGDSAGRHEPHPPRAQPRGVLLHALLRDVRVQEADRDVRELRAAVPGEVLERQGRRRSTCPACRSGSFGGSQYDDFQVPLAAGDVFVFCSDGISEAFDEAGQEFGAPRVIEVIERNHTRPAKEIVDELFAAVQMFCGDAPQSDDRTVVVVKINQLGPTAKVPEVPEVRRFRG